MQATPAVRFPIRFDAAYRALSAMLLLSPSDSYLEVEGNEVRVQMGWGFRARFARSSVAAVAEYDKKPSSRGIHGWAGRWLVNGSGNGIVSIALDPPQRGYVMGFPVRLSTLLVSVEDPGGVRATLAEHTTRVSAART
jgi:hypothetical protein